VAAETVIHSRPRRRLRVPRGRSDDALVARVRGGDDRAFELVYDRYAAGLLAFCAHMLGSRHEAEDALQHTFMSAYAALRRSDGAPIRLKAWLYTIARNRCLSMLRARREHVAFDEGRAPTDGLADEVDRRDALRGLLGDLEHLPDDQRAALVLFELGDHSQDEIAEVLGVRREKVKALVFQARESLAGWRKARETPCNEIREQLATLRGAALKRATLRRHVERCDGCREFQGEVRRQRAALGAALPIVPGAALKATVLGSILGGGGGLAAGAAGLGAVQGLAAKTLLCTVVAGGAGSAGYVAVHELETPQGPRAKQAHVAPAPKPRHAQARALQATAAAQPLAPARAAATTPIASKATHPPAKAQRGKKAHGEKSHARKSHGWKSRGEKSGGRQSHEHAGSEPRGRAWGARRKAQRRQVKEAPVAPPMKAVMKKAVKQKAAMPQRAQGQGSGKHGGASGKRVGQGSRGGSRHAGVSPR
jgi:RNA polymerase sigma factor (sigma-70 family)